MIQFLVRYFVRDYEKTEDPQVRTRYGSLAGGVGICCNAGLFAAKFAVGLLTGSISVTADAFNNLSDAASSIIGLVGVKMAEKPADDGHPFGHGRIEYIAAFIVAFLVIQVGLTLFKTSAGKILHPETLSFSWVSVFVLLLSIGVKLWLAAFNRSLGRRINSKVMMATGSDALGDVAATSATLLSILVYGFLGFNVDGLVGLGVSAVVMVAGVRIAGDTLKPLIGEAIDPKLYEELTNFIAGFEGVIGTHDLLVHNYGPTTNIASVHVEVPDDMDMEEAHRLVDRIEREARRRFDILLVTHVDPVNVHDKRLMGLKLTVAEVLEEIDRRLSFHDARVIERGGRLVLVFELVVPRTYSDAAIERLKSRIAAEVQERDPRCRCRISAEHSFVGSEEKKS